MVNVEFQETPDEADGTRGFSGGGQFAIIFDCGLLARFDHDFEKMLRFIDPSRVVIYPICAERPPIALGRIED